MFHRLLRARKEGSWTPRTWRRHLTQFRWVGAAVREGLLEEEAVNLDFDKLWEKENGHCAMCSFHTHEQGLWAVGSQRGVRPGLAPVSAVMK